MEQGHRYGSLVAAHASQKTPRAFGANGLDGRAFASDAGTAMVFHPSLEKECSVVCRIGSDHEPLDAEVAADDTAFGLWFRNLNLVCEAQIPHLANSLDLGVFPPGFRDRWVLQHSGLAKDGDTLSVTEQIAPVCQWDGRSLVNAQRPATLRFLSLVAGRHLAEQRASKLGWDSELLTDNGVESAGKPIGVQLLRLECLLRYPASGSKVSDRHGIEMLGLSNLNLDCADCFQYKTT